MQVTGTATIKAIDQAEWYKDSTRIGKSAAVFARLAVGDKIVEVNGVSVHDEGSMLREIHAGWSDSPAHCRSP